MGRAERINGSAGRHGLRRAGLPLLLLAFFLTGLAYRLGGTARPAEQVRVRVTFSAQVRGQELAYRLARSGDGTLGGATAEEVAFTVTPTRVTSPTAAGEGDSLLYCTLHGSAVLTLSPQNGGYFAGATALAPGRKLPFENAESWMLVQILSISPENGDKI